MMFQIHLLPEIQALDSGKSVIRIPDQQQVPLTPRIQRLIDTPQFRRLARISQLGMVALVYPGATHTRFEHSLGVYRMALYFLRQLSRVEAFQNQIDQQLAQRFVVSALLHDVAHWPYCHPIEDLGLQGLRRHEDRLLDYLGGTEVEQLLKEDWGLELRAVADLLCGQTVTPIEKVLYSMLSGPIDVDKMDYLYRDSLHAGVPYGQNFDRQRLLDSLCLNQQGDCIGITDKGRTAAELMVFARYVMFSEVYWHPAVRSATAMLQRVVFELSTDWNFEDLVQADDHQAHRLLHEQIGKYQPELAVLTDGLFGSVRRLYKRCIEFDSLDGAAIYQQIAHRPYRELAGLGDRVAEALSAATGMKIQPFEVLIDAPPMNLEVQFDLAVKRTRQGSFTTLGEMSPVVRTLATNQFDDLVKKVRVFVEPRIQEAVSQVNVEGLIGELL